MGSSFRDLVAWQRAMDLAEQVYSATRAFPRDEAFGLTTQLRRAAVSVASNIAEGQGRLTKGEFCHFLGQARGSLLEVETQLSISLDLQLLKKDEFHDLQHKSYEVRRLLSGLIESMRVRVPVTGNKKLETRN